MTIDLKCYCGGQVSSRICGTEQTRDESNGINDIRTYSCGGKCGRLLSCGNHKCESLCHPSLDKAKPSCSPCALLPKEVKACPCGKKRYFFHIFFECITRCIQIGAFIFEPPRIISFSGKIFPKRETFILRKN